MTFDLHLITGELILFSPVRLPAARLVQSLGPRIQSASVDWLAPRKADYDHDFLLDSNSDSQASEMAQRLSTNFAAGTEPCMILPSLMTESRVEHAAAMLGGLLAALRSLERSCQFTLRAVSLRGLASPIRRLKALDAKLRLLGLSSRLAIHPLFYPIGDRAMQARMRRNLLVWDVVHEVALIASRHGLAIPDLLRIGRFFEAKLVLWEQQGFIYSGSRSPDELRSLATLTLELLLDPAAPSPMATAKSRR